MDPLGKVLELLFQMHQVQNHWGTSLQSCQNVVKVVYIYLILAFLLPIIEGFELIFLMKPDPDYARD